MKPLPCLFALSFLLIVQQADAADPKGKPLAPPPKPEALLTSERWQEAPLKPLTPAALDELINAEFKKATIANPKIGKLQRAGIINDEMFRCRVTLDLVGRLPTVEEIKKFVADSDSAKRSKLIDELLESEEYAVRWSRYWSDVISCRVSPYMKRLAPIFELWLFEQFKKNTSWGEMVREMIAADSVLTDHAPQPPMGPKQPINGAAFFVATRYYEKTRTEGAIDAAAETARVFLGIQIQCAQCHDDRSGGSWERVQFHQLAAFYARAAGRSKHAKFGSQGALDTWALVYYPDGEYEMSDSEDIKKMLLTHPAYLDGTSPGTNLNDKERRKALADYITDKKNFWFSAAYINRIWSELLGQGFYQPIDDMGPGKDAIFPDVLARLTGSFRATDYDVKALFRLILNSQAYQRQFRIGDKPDEHFHFMAITPQQMHAPILWKALANALDLPPPKITEGADAKPWSRFSRNIAGSQEPFIKTFEFDPSLKPEGGLSQTLLLMNGSAINTKIDALPTNFLGRVLKENTDDAEVLKIVYLRALARQPTDKELDKCRKYIAKVGKRSEAFEDILWALINSPEFQVKK